MDAILSRVLPVSVCPSPRPDIIGTTTSKQATSDVKISDTLSPVPPEECLSTLASPGRTLLRSLIVPERTIALVRSVAYAIVICRSPLQASNTAAHGRAP
jgi:hypothetical protein